MWTRGLLERKNDKENGKVGGGKREECRAEMESSRDNI